MSASVSSTSLKDSQYYQPGDKAITNGQEENSAPPPNIVADITGAGEAANILANLALGPVVSKTENRRQRLGKDSQQPSFENEVYGVVIPNDVLAELESPQAPRADQMRQRYAAESQQSSFDSLRDGFGSGSNDPPAEVERSQAARADQMRQRYAESQQSSFDSLRDGFGGFYRAAEVESAQAKQDLGTAAKNPQPNEMLASPGPTPQSTTHPTWYQDNSPERTSSVWTVPPRRREDALPPERSHHQMPDQLLTGPYPFDGYQAPRPYTDYFYGRPAVRGPLANQELVSSANLPAAQHELPPLGFLPPAPTRMDTIPPWFPGLHLPNLIPERPAPLYSVPPRHAPENPAPIPGPHHQIMGPPHTRNCPLSGLPTPLPLPEYYFGRAGARTPELMASVNIPGLQHELSPLGMFPTAPIGMGAIPHWFPGLHLPHLSPERPAPLYSVPPRRAPENPAPIPGPHHQIMGPPHTRNCPYSGLPTPLPLPEYTQKHNYYQQQSGQAMPNVGAQAQWPYPNMMQIQDAGDHRARPSRLVYPPNTVACPCRFVPYTRHGKTKECDPPMIPPGCMLPIPGPQAPPIGVAGGHPASYNPIFPPHVLYHDNMTLMGENAVVPAGLAVPYQPQPEPAPGPTRRRRAPRRRNLRAAQSSIIDLSLCTTPEPTIPHYVVQ